MITFEEFKKEFGPRIIEAERTNEFLEAHYKSMCQSRIYSLLRTFEGEIWKNHYNHEELYNWCVTLETIFGITKERTGKATTEEEILNILK